MLVHTMTPQEAKAELDKEAKSLAMITDKKWYKNIGKTLRCFSFNKYPKYFRHERITKRGNKRWCLIRFNSYADYAHHKLRLVEYSIIPCPIGYRVYITSSTGLIIYSSHCIKRYIERLNLKEHGIDAIHRMFKNELCDANVTGDEKDGTIVYRGTYGLFFGTLVEPDILVFTTFVNDELLFENQEEFKNKLELKNVDFMKKWESEQIKYLKYLDEWE